MTSLLAAVPVTDLLTPLDLCAALTMSRRTYARLVVCGLPPAVTVGRGGVRRRRSRR